MIIIVQYPKNDGLCPMWPGHIAPGLADPPRMRASVDDAYVDRIAARCCHLRTAVTSGPLQQGTDPGLIAQRGAPRAAGRARLL
ncbi:MAG: hypothetical protein QOD49_1727, partial [Actinomycetota bacterium]|nr:hypothetical protein [Actinomycetota bacterium]